MKNHLVQTSEKNNRQDAQNGLYTLWEVNNFAPLRKTELLTIGLPSPFTELLKVNLFRRALTTFLINLAQYSTLDSQIGKRPRCFFYLVARILSF